MRPTLFFSLSLLLVALLTAGGLLVGAVEISPADVWRAITGDGADESTRFIIFESRLPAACSALLCGLALGAGGLLMQTVLENPLAEPGILGVSAGASLGAAVALLLPGVAIGGALTAGGTLLTVSLALAGSLAVIAVLALCSAMLRSNVLVLIAGVMVSYLVGSATSLLAFRATDFGVQTFVFWGMGDFGALPSSRLAWLAVAVALGLIPLPFLAKSLDALLLGSDYAAALGIRVRPLRTGLLVVCGWLTAIVTAACGPISFIGLAAPHIARFLLHRSDHRTLLPGAALTGALLCLLTAIVCRLPAAGGTLPAAAVTPLIGVPVVLALILQRRADI
ncbi:MAG: iron ABC transporter permease [Bacteroidaceae bacterium]|nr:iron ABC transporter permease [Bacteroidaceae bacterium]